MQAALDERGLLNARVEAVDGADPSALLAAMHTVIGRPAELACTTSHLRAIERAYREGHEVVLVLEDDASFEFVDRWPEGWERLLAALPPSFGLLQLCVGEEPKRLDHLYRRAEDVVRFTDTLYWGTVAYAIDRAGMGAVLRAFARDGRFDLTTHTGLPCAESVLMHTLARDPAVDGPFVARVPLFCYEDTVSEVHVDHIGHQRRSLEFMRRHHSSLVMGSYRSPFSIGRRIERWLTG